MTGKKRIDSLSEEKWKRLVHALKLDKEKRKRLGLGQASKLD